jgi:hypothetical protein
MVKTVHSAGGQRATTLVIFGWLFFVLSYITENSFFVFVLRAAARVLPKSLVPASRPLLEAAGSLSKAMELTAAAVGGAPRLRAAGRRAR